MATIVLSALGTLLGGPIGGAIGALIGREVDGQLFAPRVEGPRLKDLKVSGSSYGDPIARHYGTVRAPGTIVWATPLKETREKSGGGKGHAKATTYSYSISCAVLLSSARIDRVERIWADGNLLRGARGDLKTSGTLRIHCGDADQACDPLLAAELGPRCPALRGCAYAVFEDLALGDFGNRIPALSFEIVAGNGALLLTGLASEAGVETAAGLAIPELAGFSHEGGTLAQVLALVDRLHPVIPTTADGALVLAGTPPPATAPIALTEPAGWSEGDFGRASGAAHSRAAAGAGDIPSALRYYDPARDYQPGLQRPAGPVSATDAATLEFPGVIAAADARQLVDRARIRAATRRETRAVRTATLDPAVVPGALVTVAGEVGIWQVTSWEWRSGGIELALARHLTWQGDTGPADAGAGLVAPDRLPQSTVVRAFALPWDGYGSETTRQAFVAVSAASGLWSGATLFACQGDALAPIADLPPQRAVMGTLAVPLPPSNALRFEPSATATVELVDPEGELAPATLAQLAGGANRVRIGREIVQFADADPLGGGAWRLRGLLRGRGGTEAAALAGHAAGAAAILLDDRLVMLPEDIVDTCASEGIAAIGFGDAEPVVAAIDDPHASLRPLTPVHPRLVSSADGSRTASWTRRARGGWRWLDEIEQPLAEDSEAYELGVGAVGAPDLRWQLADARRVFTAGEWAALVSNHAGKTLWVRQCGRAAKSRPLLVATLA